MKRTLTAAAVVLGIVLAVLAGLLLWKRRTISALVKNWDTLKEGTEWVERVRDADEVLAYLGAHPQDVSLAVWTIGEEESGFFYRADQPRPVASTAKLLPLVAYARAVADKSVDPAEKIPLARWEAHALPATDAGLHERALETLRQEGALSGADVTPAVLARAMIELSDNAATDLLMERLGRDRIDAVPALVALPALAPPAPFQGTLLAWLGADRPGATAADTLARFAGQPRLLADEAWRLSGRLVADASFAEAERARLARNGIDLTLKEQVALGRALDTRGTARAYAALMGQIYEERLGPAESRTIKDLLAWPLKTDALRNRFDRLGTKAGSLPGILSAAYFARPKGEQKVRVLSMMVENIPMAVWIRLMETFAHQSLELDLLAKPGTVEKVKARLGAP